MHGTQKRQTDASSQAVKDHIQSLAFESGHRGGVCGEAVAALEAGLGFLADGVGVEEEHLPRASAAGQHPAQRIPLKAQKPHVLAVVQLQLLHPHSMQQLLPALAPPQNCIELISSQLLLCHYKHRQPSHASANDGRNTSR